jgi:hypothetical protein
MISGRSLARLLSILVLVIISCHAQEDPPKPEKTSLVVTLTEDDFEQQTKAASGQSNGKWFVKFYAGTFRFIWYEFIDAGFTEFIHTSLTRFCLYSQ